MKQKSIVYIALLAMATLFAGCEKEPVTTPVEPIEEEPIENGHVYVDLGLPGRTMWATMNVGANSETDYGDYFAWGETSPKEDYSWSTYKWGSSYDNFSKYCTDANYGLVDNLVTLEAIDDAATINWGGKWRMPTIGEIEELIENCTCTWAIINGVSGCKVAGKANGNTNYIFFPAAERKPNKEWGDNVSKYCYYWSASVDMEHCCMYVPCIQFSQDWYDDLREESRCLGFPIRPVYSFR